MRRTTPDILGATQEPIDWTKLPDCLTVQDLMRVLRIGRAAAYQFTETHPGLVIKVGNAKRIPKIGLRRFLARDPEIVALARPAAGAGAAARLKVA